MKDYIEKKKKKKKRSQDFAQPSNPAAVTQE